MLLEVVDELLFGRWIQVRRRQFIRHLEGGLGTKQVRARPIRPD